MKKIILIWLLVLLAPLVMAAPPTTPTAFHPEANDILFDYPVLSCNGSTDPDSDPISILFYEINHINASPEFISGGVTQDYWYNHPNKSADWDGDSGMILDMNPPADKGHWADATGLENGLCERGDGEAYYENTTNQNWVTHKTGCENLNGSNPQGWHLAVVNSQEENDLLANLCTGANYCYIGGNFNLFPTEVYWAYNFTSNVTIGNSTNTTLDYIPSLNNPSNWSCLAYDTNNELSSPIGNFKFSLINVSACDITSSNLALNLTHRDEEEQTLLLNATNNIDIIAKNSAAEDIDSKSFNFALSNNNTFGICITPIGSIINITGLSDYTPENASHTLARQYYWREATIIGGTPTHIDLFSLQDDLATNTIFRVLRDGAGVSDILIHLERFNAGTGLFTTVAMAETDNNGEDNIPLRLSDAFYRVKAFEGLDLVFDGGSQHIVSSPYEIILTEGGTTVSNYAPGYSNLNNLLYNLSWNTSGTNNVALSFSDPTGISTNVCLRVEKYTQQNGTQVVSYNCSSSASGTLFYELNDLENDHIAQVVAENSGIFRILDDIVINIKRGLEVLISDSGLFYSLLIVLSLAMLGTFNPQAAIGLSLVGVVISFMLGFLNVTWAAVAGLIIAGGLLLYKTR